MSNTWTKLHHGSSDYDIDALAYRHHGTYYTRHEEYGKADPKYAVKELDGADFLDVIQKFCGPNEELKKAPLDAGCRYPRIWRPNVSLKETEETDLCVSAIEQMENLLNHLEEVFRFVHPAPDNFDAYGTEIRNLLILACTEVEAQCKGILTANHTTPAQRFFTTTDYVVLLRPLKLDGYDVSLSRYRNLPPVAPFKSWNQQQPTGSLPWYDAYNKTKHDREGHLRDATLRHVVSAVGALPILIAAQFGKSAFDDHDVKKTFKFESHATWGYRDYYYYPIKGESWVLVDCDFHSY